MHVEKSCIAEICPELSVDGWNVTSVSEVETGECTLVDEYSGLHKIAEVNQEKYLGDILSNDGKNSKNIAARKNRGIGIELFLQFFTN